MRLINPCILLIACGCVDVHRDDDRQTSLACTELGCGGGLSVTLHPANNAWQAGSYTFELTSADTKHTCAIELPAGLPSNPSSSAMLPCEPKLPAFFAVERQCIVQQIKGAMSSSCITVDDHWLLNLTLDTTPASLTVHVDRDSTPIFDQTLTPTYREDRPNGPGCEPVCTQSELDLLLDG